MYIAYVELILVSGLDKKSNLANKYFIILMQPLHKFLQPLVPEYQVKVNCVL